MKRKKYWVSSSGRVRKIIEPNIKQARILGSKKIKIFLLRSPSTTNIPLITCMRRYRYMRIETLKPSHPPKQWVASHLYVFFGIRCIGVSKRIFFIYHYKCFEVFFWYIEDIVLLIDRHTHIFVIILYFTHCVNFE